ncbi:MAG: cytidylate kinase [Euryarchaeota archaeon]|nr:cytidylate kinase [Euryarchaeota archaeon]|tara:strand:- start:2367 stop:2894 length:528 start_codon:yes stop_codon:yes gene_type:complete
MVTISGPPGSGTSTLVSKLSESLDWDSINGGEVFREEASTRSLSVEELSAQAKKDLDVDRELDKLLQSRMTSEECPEIVESRLSGWWAHKNDIDCLRVWVQVSDHERARRIQMREGGSIDECLERSRQRQSDDMDRYMELYGINLDDMSPYNLVIDADEKDENEVFEIVVNELEQ